MNATQPYLQLRQLINQYDEHTRILIYMHDFPDPDAIGAAFGLKVLIEKISELSSTITYGGIIGRAENRAMIAELGIELYPIHEIQPQEFDVVAMVDTQPNTGNNCLGSDVRPDIVIDHHPLRPATRQCRFYDVREEMGATASIIFSYFEGLSISVPGNLQTAIFYALRTDTHDLSWNTTDYDRKVFHNLCKNYDPSKFRRIISARVPRTYFSVLTLTLDQAVIADKRLIFANLGSALYPELVAEVADLLVRLEGAEFCLTTGFYDNAAYLSMRTNLSGVDCGTIIRKIVGDLGASGGHGSMAGGKIELDSEKKYHEIIFTIMDAYRSNLDVEEEFKKLL